MLISLTCISSFSDPSCLFLFAFGLCRFKITRRLFLKQLEPVAFLIESFVKKTVTGPVEFPLIETKEEFQKVIPCFES